MKKTLIIVAVVVLMSVAAIGAYILRPSQEASAPIQATPIASQNLLPTPAVEVVQVDEAEAPSPEPAEPGPSGVVIYRISQDQSQVRFSLDEILRGRPFTPVGITDQVAGEISVDFTQKLAEVGVIQVNARTLKTDSEFRDRAINNEILDTAEFEFITFVPTQVSGLPQDAAVGQEVQFQITGDLTIRDITQSVTFEVTATLVDETRLEGFASATVLRSDYGLVIPSVPSVADVSEEVLLEFDFVALSE